MARSDTGPFSLVPEWVLDSTVSDRALRLYAVLARYADRDDGTCFPTRRTLADRLRCSLDSIDRAKAELVDAGAIAWNQRAGTDGDLTSNEYTVHRVQVAAGSRLPLGTDAATGSRTDAAENKNQVEREPSNDRALRLVESEETARDEYEEEFDRAWRNYPRKTARARAFRAYQATRRRGVPAATLLAAVFGYARERTGQPQEFTLHGSTFFGPDERWKDYLPVEPNAAAPDAPNLDALAERAAAGPRTGSRYTTRQPWEEES